MRANRALGHISLNESIEISQKDPAGCAAKTGLRGGRSGSNQGIASACIRAPEQGFEIHRVLPPHAMNAALNAVRWLPVRHCPGAVIPG
jgi:hypothetical protein